MIKLFILATLMFFGLRIWAVGLANINADDGGERGPSTALVRGLDCNTGDCHISSADGMLTRNKAEYRQEAQNINNTAVDKPSDSESNSIPEQKNSNKRKKGS